MSSYTMELRTYIEQITQYRKGISLSDKIKYGRKHLFDFNYPFFDEDYRHTFEENIIREFYTREIGFETEELFKLKLENWLNINMPYFNKLFELETLKYDILNNTDVKIDRERQKDKDSELERDDKRQGTSNTETSGRETVNTSENGSFESNNFNRKINSDVPDTRLQLTTNGDGTGVLEYASEIEENKGNESSKQDRTGNSSSNVSNDGSMRNNEDYSRDEKGKEKEVEDFKEHRRGKIGQQSYSSMVIEYRQSLLRVEKMIHKEMQQLFMLVY